MCTPLLYRLRDPETPVFVGVGRRLIVGDFRVYRCNVNNGHAAAAEAAEAAKRCTQKLAVIIIKIRRVADTRKESREKGRGEVGYCGGEVGRIRNAAQALSRRQVRDWFPWIFLAESIHPTICTGVPKKFPAYVVIRSAVVRYCMAGAGVGWNFRQLVHHC